MNSYLNALLTFLGSLFGAFLGYLIASYLKNKLIQKREHFQRLKPNERSESPLVDFVEKPVKPRRKIWNAEENALRKDAERAKYNEDEFDR